MTLSPFDRSRSTVRLGGFVGLCLYAGTIACQATPMLTRDEATAKVLANGFKSVAKAEPAALVRGNLVPQTWASPAEIASWDVWASKDGIAYRVTVDASTGDLLKAAPAVEDD